MVTMDHDVEYKHLMDHYYNDDKAYWTAITFFFAIHGALLSIFTSTFFANVPIYRIVFCVFGLWVAALGFLGLVRIRAHR